MGYEDRTLRRSGYLVVVLGLTIGIAGCGGGAQTVTDDVPVTDDIVVTETDKKVKTDYETDVETDVETDYEDGDGGPGADAGDDTGGASAQAGDDCPPGEVLSAPGNKCRTADDPDDGK